MINFLLESTVSLIAFLTFYHLFLEREKMHQFNRFYLLFSIVISLIIPFISIEIIQEIENIPLATNFPIFIDSENNIPINETTNYTPILLWSLYIIISFVLLFRFLKNILYFKKTIQSNETVSYKNATLVLLNQETIPHTFLNYIFINKESYKNRTIENELYDHELTHVNQNHSYDILGIEFLKIIFWFNPVFYIYKKAIQLNHEFIADEKVVKTHKNVSFYQSLLLNTNGNATYYLASNLNYLITKKRLIMMTKTTSKFSGFIKKAGIIPLLTLMIYFLCTDLVAQEKKQPDSNLLNKELDSYYDDTRVIIKDKDGKIITDKKYSELSEEEKMQVPPPPPKPEKLVVSETQFKDFKNQTKYAIWIDGKHVNNSELNKYNSSDFVYFNNSHVYKNARSKKFPQENQASLYTEKGFSEAFEMQNDKMGGTIEISENKINLYPKIEKVKKIEVAKDTNKVGYISSNEKLDSENIKVKPATLDETEKANILKVDKLSDFDTKDKKEGYIYMNNATYFFSKNDKGEIEYFNRWGNRVNEKGEKLAETNNKK
ncbi:M56 family metallopeptidase [uncultured Flavobacterium sp.]|uniref:M56 family metallopeptidase n=1 Tax=uncultured Flavobacterium sp. TaxID=165435 RepID=UPI0030EDCCC4|tara:strand:- start:230658 stop:232298 length:1641 start_codon:yes stop_codon:yes gene_type:complete